ncbi:MAG: amidase, partial [Chloroflexota bacterium]
YDPADASSADVPVPQFREAIGKEIKGLRIGVPREFFFTGIDEEVDKAVQEAILAFERLGVEVEPISLPHVDYAPNVFPPIIHSEAAAFHEQWLLTRPEDYGADVRARLEVGLTALATQYVNAQRGRNIIRRDFEEALGRVDAIVTPTMPTVAAPIGAEKVTIKGETIEVRSAYNRFTSPINLTGLPAISVPCGFTATDLPIGVQLVGRAFDESTLLTLAHAYESSTDWHKRQPPL